MRAEDVDFELSLAKCHACNAVYNLTGRRPPSRPKAALPERFQVEEHGQGTTISWRWFRAYHVFMVFFCLLWNGFLFVWYFVALTHEAPLIVTLFPLLHTGVGLFLIYMTVAGFVNSTRIEVSREELRIQHGPLPWSGNRTLSGRELTQVYGQEVRGSKGSVSYSLLALDTQRRQVKLLTGLEAKEQALYLEQALERRLGIEDSPVEGELARRDQVA
ncbi:Hypothetical protein AA314_01891 [Archangium gephyra]|uniref:Uncharacterized protein n=1 Tax=Archangium gephyra TaxID=48 RepID=A0AAC8Q359_9BACT|nr:Hypothetical protein AA314_01891 [Archangium gephyra]